MNTQRIVAESPTRSVPMLGQVSWSPDFQASGWVLPVLPAPKHDPRDAQILRLQRALDAATDVGIYPQAFTGQYEQRTPYMEGWNAHAQAAMKAVVDALEKQDWDNAQEAPPQ